MASCVRHPPADKGERRRHLWLTLLIQTTSHGHASQTPPSCWVLQTSPEDLSLTPFFSAILEDLTPYLLSIQDDS
ncbi:hypothetical protein E2C01_028293 [Portunus trituberculatus]|uniref:Uncharacterized protein n=1 Tax=Portunus trituberculatus TaxID=210409 RepID=A0A5B7EK30_PORTR|nr:hypothetical protein [Portunus trituberculatus]